LRRLITALLAVALLVGLPVAGCSGPSFNMVGEWQLIGDSVWPKGQPEAVAEFSKKEVTLEEWPGRWRIAPDGPDYRLEIRLRQEPIWIYRLRVVDNEHLELYIPLRESPQITLHRVRG